MGNVLPVCNCNTCSKPIEFEPTLAGQTFCCPHCGVDTILYVPSAPAPSKRNWKPFFNLLAVLCGIGIMAGVAGAIIAASDIKTLEAAKEKTGSAMLGIMAAVVIGAVFVIAVLWVLFPVFVFFSLGRLEKVSKQIERNTRNPGS